MAKYKLIGKCPECSKDIYENYKIGDTGFYRCSGCGNNVNPNQKDLDPIEKLYNEQVEKEDNPLEPNHILDILKTAQRVPYEVKIRYDIQPGYCEEVGQDHVGSMHCVLYQKSELIGTKLENIEAENLESVFFYLSTDEHWIVAAKLSDPTISLRFIGERPDFIQEHVADVKVSTDKEYATTMAIYFNKIDKERVYCIELSKTI